jgi:hypothetical protein
MVGLVAGIGLSIAVVTHYILRGIFASRAFRQRLREAKANA